MKMWLSFFFEKDWEGASRWRSFYTLSSGVHFRTPQEYWDL